MATQGSPTLSTMSVPQPSMDQVAAQQQATCSMLEFLLSTATRRQHLRLSCRNLQELPAADNLAQLSSLRSLTISKCSSLQELPASIGCLSQLTSLVLYACDELVDIPRSIGRLTALQELSIRECFELPGLPASISRLTALESLELENNTCLGDLEDGVFAGMAAH